MIIRHKDYKSGGAVFAYTAPASITEKKDEKPYLSLAPVSINVIGVHLNKAKLKLKVGQAEELKAAVLPDNAANQAITWSITDPSVADLEINENKAIIKGKQAGKTIIIAAAEDGSFRDLCIVTVHDYLTTNK
ncbi:Ig-like domain-containing protein [Ectobacillus panaciterrae]|uniref:Ig-like domain-containing protein n=1 Tax=Ectobacillus panaciterrae TaxID=363872 RepID=UPI00040B8A84|nr:Ig-like domain-containing protein [Ectobacillus panaciterrae]